MLEKKTYLENKNEYGRSDMDRLRYLSAIQKKRPYNSVLTDWYVERAHERGEYRDSGFNIWAGVPGDLTKPGLLGNKVYAFFDTALRKNIFEAISSKTTSHMKDAGHLVFYGCGDAHNDIAFLRSCLEKKLITKEDLKSKFFHLFDISKEGLDIAEQNLRNFLMQECGLTEDEIEIQQKSRDWNKLGKGKIFEDIDISKNKKIFCTSFNCFSNLLESVEDEKDERQSFFAMREDADIYLFFNYFKDKDTLDPCTRASYGERVIIDTLDETEQQYIEKLGLIQKDFDELRELINHEMSGTLRSLGWTEDDIQNIDITLDVQENEQGKTLYECFVPKKDISINVAKNTITYDAGEKYPILRSKRCNPEKGVSEIIDTLIGGRDITEESLKDTEVVGGCLVEVHGKKKHQQRLIEEQKKKLHRNFRIRIENISLLLVIIFAIYYHIISTRQEEERIKFLKDLSYKFDRKEINRLGLGYDPLFGVDDANLFMKGQTFNIYIYQLFLNPKEINYSNYFDINSRTNATYRGYVSGLDPKQAQDEFKTDTTNFFHLVDLFVQQNYEFISREGGFKNDVLSPEAQLYIQNTREYLEKDPQLQGIDILEIMKSNTAQLSAPSCNQNTHENYGSIIVKDGKKIVIRKPHLEYNLHDFFEQQNDETKKIINLTKSLTTELTTLYKLLPNGLIKANEIQNDNIRIARDEDIIFIGH